MDMLDIQEKKIFRKV